MMVLRHSCNVSDIPPVGGVTRLASLEALAWRTATSYLNVSWLARSGPWEYFNDNAEVSLSRLYFQSSSLRSCLLQDFIRSGPTWLLTPLVSSLKQTIYIEWLYCCSVAGAGIPEVSTLTLYDFPRVVLVVTISLGPSILILFPFPIHSSSFNYRIWSPSTFLNYRARRPKNVRDLSELLSKFVEFLLRLSPASSIISSLFAWFCTQTSFFPFKLFPVFATFIPQRLW